MENIIEKLKKLKGIQPDAEYSRHSKLVILAMPIASEKKPDLALLDNVREILKTFKNIQPDAEYSRISKLAIFGVPAIPQRKPIFNWQVAFSLASLLLILISGNIMRNLKPSAPNLNVSALETEFKNLDIDIHLAKIDYSQRIDKTVSLALKEITEKQANHLNPIILESEQNKLNGEPANDKEIDNLLNQILL